MKETFYFTHDYGARRDPKLVNVLMKHGTEGIGVYWCVIEMLYEEAGFLLRTEYARITFELHSNYDTVKSVIENFDLFKFDDTRFWSESALERLNERMDKSEKARKNIQKRWEKYGSNTTVLPPKYDRNTIKERKGEERIGEETSEDVLPPKKPPPRFTIPTVEEMKAYGIEIMLCSTECEKCFDYYTANGWKVGRNQMKDWKAAMRNWKKNENDYKGKQNGSTTGTKRFRLTNETDDERFRDKLKRTGTVGSVSDIVQPVYGLIEEKVR